jgi:hypothetical protein
MSLQLKRYKTQWAAQFYVAAELTRRGYLVSLTLGNAPIVDILSVSPSGRQFMIDVKGQGTKNFWLLKRRESREDLFYVLVYIPPDFTRPDFFIMESIEVMTLWDEYRDKLLSRGKTFKESFLGINWSTPFPFKDKWDKLPK